MNFKLPTLIVSLFLSLTVLLLSMIYNYSFFEYKISLGILLFCVFFSFYIYKGNESYISVFGFFVISNAIFMLSRPVIGLFNDELPIISIGNKITYSNVIYSVSILISMILFIILFYNLCSRLSLVIYKSIPDIYIENKTISVSVLLASIISGLVFVYYSNINASVLKNSGDYFSFIDGLNTTYYKYFFISKYLLFIYVIFTKNRNSLIISTFLMFLFSIGFIIIGQRGYTISYLFLLVFAINIKKEIDIFKLTLLAFVIMFVSSLFLNLRLGYNVFDNVWEMFYLPFYQQGASFEVVFGASNFYSSLLKCIPYNDYFSGYDFGTCVDHIRGVNFSVGSFASSFYAEVIYFLPYGIAILILFSLLLKVLDFANKEIKDDINNKKSKLILLMMIPNLVYFSRSSAFDFILKFLQVYIFLVFLVMILRLITKNNKVL